MNALLQVRHIDSGYGDVQILRDVSLTVHTGELVSLIGANGAGKTTLIRTIMGTLAPQRGEIEFEGRRIDAQPAHRIARLGIAQVMEGRRLFGHMEVEDNLRVGGDLLGDRQRLRDNLDWVYSMFPRLAERRRQLARSFSGGEQQMLAIARALMTGPKLLLLDEPSIGLAPIMVNAIFDKLPAIRERGITILLVEQDVQRALSIAQRAYVLEHGSIVMQGPARTLLADEGLKRAYLGL